MSICLIFTEKSVVNVEKYFLKLLHDDQSLSAGLAAIKTLLMVLEQTKCMYKNAPISQPTKNIALICVNS